MDHIPRPIKILIVDDDKVLNREMEFHLTKAGFIATSVFDGMAALAILRKEHFDLIILDLVMPEMTGFEVLTELKKMNITTPVAVLSLLGQSDDVLKAKSLGAATYFSKKSEFFNEVADYAAKLSVS